ncbi:unnamed protein product [Coffea canephora]|uniref:RIN4 pathogenic type III effector avirulence factor Avr cleavage site domain-containing protein n=2 Tax=Coffea TaxID=13442 RepID=A0A068U6F8_COFCA|nr:unnamed protein product [Coffea canephora]
MAARPHVPQFGNWDSQENVPYTLYFDNARKGRGGKMINPNDPEENPEMFRQFAPPAPAPSNIRPQTEEPVGRGAVRAQHEYRGSREDGNFRQFVDSPARTDNPGRRTSGESTHHNSGRPTRHSAGSEHSFERSPLHSHHPAKLAGRGGTSPAWDGKSSHDSSHGTYGKSRMKQVSRVEESPDRGAAVPRFGDWDENNPQSADNYTHIFNKVREERHTGPSNLQAGNNFEPSYHMKRKQNASGDRKGCCFPWFGK